MICALQYKVGRGTLRAIEVLVKNPGLTATQYAAIVYPRFHRAGWLGAMSLYHLTQKKLIRARWEPPYHRAGPVKPQKKYYVTDLGYEVHEFYARQRYSQDAYTAKANRAR